MGFDGHHLHTQELENEMFINLHFFSDILMRAEQMSTSHLVNLVNIASRHSKTIYMLPG